MHVLLLRQLRMDLILYKDILAVLNIFEICSLNESLLLIINPKLLTFNDAIIIISTKVTIGNLTSEIYIFSSSVIFLFNKMLFSKKPVTNSISTDTEILIARHIMIM